MRVESLPSAFSNSASVKQYCMVRCSLLSTMTSWRMSLLRRMQSAMSSASRSNSASPKPKRVISLMPMRRAPEAVKPSSSGVA